MKVKRQKTKVESQVLEVKFKFQSQIKVRRASSCHVDTVIIRMSFFHVQ